MIEDCTGAKDETENLLSESGVEAQRAKAEKKV